MSTRLRPENPAPAYKWIVLANVMIGTFMAVLDATIVNVGLPRIMAAFGVSVDSSEWIITAYMLVFAVMLPTSGWLADRFGYKKIYMLAMFLFTLGSGLCSLAWDINALIFFRIVQGMGAGFMMPVGMAILTREFPPEKRGIALGFWGVSAAASVSLGPMLGGYLIDNLSWQAIFSVNVPLGVVGIIVTAIVQREYRHSARSPFDIPGFVSMTLFLVFLLLALTDANAAWNSGGWHSPLVLSFLGIAAAGLIIFIPAELTTDHPLIDLRLLRNFNFGITNLILFVFGLGMFGSTFLLPLYLQNSLGYTALQAGAVFLPVGLLQGVMSPVSGILADRINPKVPAIIGIGLLAFSLFLNGHLSLLSSHHQIMVPLIIRGFAMGMAFTPLSTLALSELPPDRMAQASGMFNVIRQVGGSFGIALLGTLLTQRNLFHQAAIGEMVSVNSPVFQGTIAQIQQHATGSLGVTGSVAASGAHLAVVTRIVQEAFVSAIDDCFIFASIITAVGVIPILFLRRRHAEPTGAGKQKPWEDNGAAGDGCPEVETAVSAEG